MKNRTISIIAIICLLFPFMAWAQSDTGGIKGKILDPESAPGAFANVVLYMMPDSTIAKVEYSDSAGAFSFANLPAGEYWLDVSFIGMSSYISPVLRLADNETIDLPTIHLADNTAELAEIVVTGKKPILELKNDRVVFNVEKSINAAGVNALELLRKSPGVMADNSGNLSMMGRNGVIIAINGKLSPLRGEDLAAYLRTLQGFQIEAIEVITNPGANFEADGNAGIINIRLKKDINKGTNLSASTGYSFGQAPRYNGAISGNYRNEKINAFGSYGYSDYQRRYTEAIDIELLDLFFNQSINGNLDIRTHTVKTGIDYSLSTESVLGFMAVGNFSQWDWLANTRTPIVRIQDGLTDRILLAQSHSVIDRADLTFNLNYRFENKEGALLNIDADYALYDNNRENTQPNEFRDASDAVSLSKQVNYTNSPTDIGIYTFRMDHERPLGNGKFSTGLKLSYVNADNLFDFYNVIDSQLILNLDQSNAFAYQENVNAAYLSYAGKLGGKFSFSAGLRGEQTNSSGELTSRVSGQNQKTERNYLDLFPSLKLDFNPDERQYLQLSFSRRINRPPYHQLNPFLFKNDELSYTQGNPFLQPEYTTIVRLQHSFQYKLNTTFTYSHTENLIASLYKKGEGNSNVYTSLNLANQNHYSLNIEAPASLASWWSTYTSITGFYVENIGSFDGLAINKHATSLNLFLQNTIQLPAGFNMEVSGSYNSPTLWGANDQVGAIWTVDAGIDKSILNGRGKIAISVSDIFKTNIWPTISAFGQIYVDYTLREDTRRLNINFSYLFGNNKLKEERKRETGLEAEKGRIN